MLIDDVKKVDASKIKVAAASVTLNTSEYNAPTLTVGSDQFSATYFDTVGFNAGDIDADKVFNDLKEVVQFKENIHKILIVHKAGRARVALVGETQRTIELLTSLGAHKRNVYLTITFASDYNTKILKRLKDEVTELYKEFVLPKNIFFSPYVLLSEIDEEYHPHYLKRLMKSHDDILARMMEPVEPFRPLVASLKRLDQPMSWLNLVYTVGYLGFEFLQNDREQVEVVGRHGLPLECVYIAVEESKPLLCELRFLAWEYWLELTALALSSSFVLYVYWKIRSWRWHRNSVKELTHRVEEYLREHSDEDIAIEHLRDEFWKQQDESVWKDVVKVFEKDTRVEAGKNNFGIALRHAWRWVAPIRAQKANRVPSPNHEQARAALLTSSSAFFDVQ